PHWHAGRTDPPRRSRAWVKQTTGSALECHRMVTPGDWVCSLGAPPPGRGGLAPAGPDQTHHQDAGQEADAKRNGARREGPRLHTLLQIVELGARPVPRLCGTGPGSLGGRVLRGTQMLFDLFGVRRCAGSRADIAILCVHAPTLQLAFN